MFSIELFGLEDSRLVNRLILVILDYETSFEYSNTIDNASL